MCVYTRTNQNSSSSHRTGTRNTRQLYKPYGVLFTVYGVNLYQPFFFLFIWSLSLSLFASMREPRGSSRWRALRLGGLCPRFCTTTVAGVVYNGHRNSLPSGFVNRLGLGARRPIDPNEHKARRVDIIHRHNNLSFNDIKFYVPPQSVRLIIQYTTYTIG